MQSEVEKLMGSDWKIIRPGSEENPRMLVDMGGVQSWWEYHEMFDDWNYLENGDDEDTREIVHAITEQDGFYEKFYAMMGIEI